MKDFFDIIKSLFSKKEKSGVNVAVTNNNQSKKIKKSKRLKHSTDNSTDNSTNVNGTIDNSVHETNIYGVGAESCENSDLIITARWMQLVPHKIEKVKNGFDCFNVLVPKDEGYISPSVHLDLDDRANKNHAIVVLVKRNSFIKNLRLYSISIEGDGCKTNHIVNKDIFGLLDKDRSFAVNGTQYKECSAQITIQFNFEKKGLEYRQTFEFSAKNNSAEFVLNKYKEPFLLTF